ncbi:type II secretion system secretin GspD [Cocleimonas sp. KMM 6892]|uniref:type II secretion system secretin GspD n=1 Tax=unclassified Cocleimonas TaxID=2639732 RepID=UPI002DBCB243|nr:MULTISPECIES: type II secretion system secretin GspD [unclassified Cocleimonas]MEB8432900.1 type II secretion system secretin GspD [Cocleimonas sp. KMM 6892]MEC4716119.1 type II secretion system secretin GspD [Cocleimonas sp. KMM 6895]MEC4745580.1 type II secretion system secretin GspD [Cocleimonas sp. KMM 6896]
MVFLKAFFGEWSLFAKNKLGFWGLLGCKKNASSLVFAISLSVAFTTPAVYAEESAQINLRDVEIPTLIETVSRITGKSFIIDPRVKGRVTVITSSDIDKNELYETFLSILQVHGFSAVPAGEGSNLVKVVPSNQAKQQPVPVIGEKEEQSKKKSSRDADELITRVIRVEHVPAAMLVPILRPLVPSTGQLQAYGPSNTILISDRAANIERLIKVIKRMDRADDEELEVIPLKFASAKDLAATIQTLQQSTVKGAPTKNKISADDRTNSLLISGDKSSRQQVRKIIAKLDTSQPLQEKTKVIYLKYAKAVDLAKVLTGFSAVQKTTKATTKGAAGTQKADIDIQADEASNSLIITAEPDVQRNLAKVISRLDVRRAQVMVEAVIAEVSASLSKTLGANLGISSTEGIIGATGTVAGVSSLLSIFTADSDDIATGLSGDGGTLGLIDNVGSNKFGLLVEALSGDGATNVLSTPTVLALDNEEASIVIGEEVPFVTGSYTSTGDGTSVSNPFQTVEREDIGITLKIKPQINDGSSVRLDIEQEVSSISASSTSAEDRITNKRSIATSVMVEDDQVLVLGGLMRDQFTDQVSKVPLLGDIPVLGKLFSSTTTEKSKTNLMVFIHPMIMRDVLSGDHYTRQKYNKLKQAQKVSNITNRGILKDKASQFPADLRRDLATKLTPAQKKQIIIREQQQREREYKNRIQQAKLAQQKQAAALQARRNGTATTTLAKPQPVANMQIPARLKQVMPVKRRYQENERPNQ